MRYVLVTQNDLQQGYQKARQHIKTPNADTELPSIRSTMTAKAPGGLTSLTAVHRLIEMFRRQHSATSSRLKIARLTNRLFKITAELYQLIRAQK
jgi:hypothetical protein